MQNAFNILPLSVKIVKTFVDGLLILSALSPEHTPLSGGDETFAEPTLHGAPGGPSDPRSEQ